jgi:hypothetical protein
VATHGVNDGLTEKKELDMANKLGHARTKKEREITRKFIEKHGMKFCTSCNSLKNVSYFKKRKKGIAGLSSACAACILKSDIKYKNSERGFLMEIWNSVKKRKNKNIECSINSFEEFRGLWEEQKEQRGWVCPYLGIKMTHERYKNTNGKKTGTNLSIDRIDTNKGYTPQNIIFCSWAANNMKNNITYEVAQSFVQIYLERYYHE